MGLSEPSYVTFSQQGSFRTLVPPSRETRSTADTKWLQTLDIKKLHLKMVTLGDS